MQLGVTVLLDRNMETYTNALQSPAVDADA